jgi:hypothetical protein
MSLILDALKKLERDKITRRKRSVHIASDILLSEPEARRKARILIVGLAGAALAVVVFAVVYTNPLSTLSPAPERGMQAVPAPAPSVQPAVAPPASDQVAKPAAPEAAPSKKESRTSTARTPKSNVKSSGAVAAAEPRTVPRRPPQKAAVSDTAPPPALTVSGIVWAENRSSRRAMVDNGIVSEGSSVGGARVTEIHPDHVRFSYQGRPFSVYMK